MVVFLFCQVCVRAIEPEASQITHDVARAIHVTSRVPVIQHTRTAIYARCQSMGNTGIINRTANKALSNAKACTNTDYYQDIMNSVASKTKKNEYWFYVPFSQYFFENITDYASIAYYHDNHCYDKPVIFNQKAFKDCKLLKNHITMKYRRTIKLHHGESA